MKGQGTHTPSTAVNTQQTVSSPLAKPVCKLSYKWEKQPLKQPPQLYCYSLFSETWPGIARLPVKVTLALCGSWVGERWYLRYSIAASKSKLILMLSANPSTWCAAHSAKNFYWKWFNNLLNKLKVNTQANIHCVLWKAVTGTSCCLKSSRRLPSHVRV